MGYRVAPSYTAQCLEGVDIFQGRADGDLERVATLCQEWTFRVEDSLGVQNEPDGFLYIVREGEVTATNEWSGASVIVRTMKPQ